MNEGLSQEMWDHVSFDSKVWPAAVFLCVALDRGQKLLCVDCCLGGSEIKVDEVHYGLSGLSFYMFSYDGSG